MTTTALRTTAPEREERSVAEVVTDLHRVIDELGGLIAESPAAALVAQITEVRRAVSRVQSIELKLVTAAQQSRVAAKAGHADTGAWLAQVTRTAGREAAQAARLADALQRRLPATDRALGEGELSREHAVAIDQVIRQLPTGVTREQSAQVESALVDKAKTMDPLQLRRAGRRALAVVERDQAKVDAHEDQVVRSEEERAWDKARLTLRDNGDGTTTGHFTVPTLAGSILHKVLHSLASPRRAKVGAPAAQAGAPSPDQEGPAWDRRLGQAFVEVLEHLPSDRIHGKVGATLLVTLDLEQLSGKLHAAGVDTGDAISAATARRLACQAGLVPAVLGRQSQLLDLGRSARFFTEAHRTALGLRHSYCAADGCQRPYAWCELHHRDPWASGGRTDLADALPLCGFHHRRIHDPAYAHQERPGPNGLPVVTFRQISRC